MPLGTSGAHAKPGRIAAKTRATEKAPAKQQDAIELLMADHKEVEELFKQFQKMKNDGAGKGEIIGRICEALKVHAQIEEEIFYPAAREALASKDEIVLDEAEVEHASIKSLVEQLEDADPEDTMCDAKVKVLCEYVTHHVKEEERTMFPKIKKTSLDLDDLGAELLARKNELME